MTRDEMMLPSAEPQAAPLGSAPKDTGSPLCRAAPGSHVIIDYTNWRGERSKRRIVPNMESLWFGFNDWHREAQWLLDAYDVEKGEIRTFAMKDIHSWTPAVPVHATERQANPLGADPSEGKAVVEGTPNV